VRSLVPALAEDRVLGPDIESLAVAVAAGRFSI
jgi:histidine ammonia-lyase